MSLPNDAESLFDDYGDDDPSPICGFCGVSALAPEVPGEDPTCENADCSAFGELVD